MHKLNELLSEIDLTKESNANGGKNKKDMLNGSGVQNLISAPNAAIARGVATDVKKIIRPQAEDVQPTADINALLYTNL